MKFGVGIFPMADARETLQRAVLAEELGFDAVWVADTHLIWREAFTLLGAIAASTKRIELGPGVTHPIVRHPSAIAAAAATLAELAPGRVKIGLGIGDSGPSNMGLPRASLAQLEVAIGDIKGLLAGREMDASGTRLRLAYAPGQSLPVYVAGVSDRTHKMSGGVADGALIAGALDDLAGSIAAVREGERQAGRASGSVDVVLFTTGCLDNDEALAREAVRGVVARKAILTLGRAERLGTLDARDRQPLERLRQAYDTHHHMQPRYNELVPDRWVDRFALAGRPERLLAGCRRAAEDGASQVSVVFNGQEVDAQMRRFSQAVIQRM